MEREGAQWDTEYHSCCFGACVTECGKAEEKGLLSTPLGARREQPWLRMTVTVAEMRHCPPVASQQATPTRSSKQNSKGWKGAHYKYHPASQTHPGRGGETWRQGWFFTRQMAAQTNALWVITMVTITITMQADAQIKLREGQVLHTQELCGHKNALIFWSQE